MPGLVYSLGFFLAIFANFAALDAEGSTTTPNGLTYAIIKVGAEKKVHLTITGTEYTTAANCHIQVSNAVGEAFGEIADCPGNKHSTAPANCVLTCTGADNKLPYDKFSPRTKYTAIFSDSTASAASSKVKPGTVFGLDIPLLVDPQITISLDESTRKLKLSPITCDPVDCPITYKGVVYAAGTAGSDCKTASTASLVNEVEFDLMIPHYEMNCVNYPSFFYKMQNNYTLSNMDVYKPQYYVKTHSTDPKKYLLKFTNKFRFEICRFSIRDVPDSGENTNTFTSNCGGTGKQCYAPCNNVELISTASKKVVEILIQPRFNSLETPTISSSITYYGYRKQKYVVTETDAANGKLLYTESAEGVTLNVPLFSSGNTNKFTECNVKYYAADKPAPSEATTDVATTQTNKECTAALVITGLQGGKPYILEIKSGSSASGAVPGSFKEHIFFRTDPTASKSFVDDGTIVTETSVAIKALGGDATNIKTDATCAYYISLHGKGVFTCVKCESGYPCRGFCKETHTVGRLTPGTQYDLMVAAHKDYGFKIYTITTSLSTLTLQHQFMNKGFKVSGVLSTAYDAAVCTYKVKVKRGADYVQINECPPAAGTTAGAVTGATGTGTGATGATGTGTGAPGATGSSPSAGGAGGATPPQSKLSKFTVARSADAQTTTTENTTPTTPAMPACTTTPLCSEILIAEGYEADKEYQVLVTAVGRSSETTINIPAYPLPTAPTDVAKQITVEITRDGTTFKVVSVLPTGVAENSLCKWELRNWQVPSKPIIKKCTVLADDECTAFPPCKEITITGVEDTNDYHMSVIHSEDASISGVGTIEKGADSNKSTSSQTLIILVAVPVVIILAGIGFYFGYMKNRN